MAKLHNIVEEMLYERSRRNTGDFNRVRKAIGISEKVVVQEIRKRGKEAGGFMAGGSHLSDINFLRDILRDLRDIKAKL